MGQLDTAASTHRRRRRLWLVIGVALAVLIPARFQMVAEREELGLKPRSEAEAAGLWETMVNSGTGAFRAFGNLALFMSIREAEDEGEFFRLVELYNRILILQPRNPAIQVYLAEQMIDTISTKADNTDTAWGWVRQGKDLLDESQAKNPYSSRLRLAQAFFYYRKMSQYPFHILRHELARGAESPLALEPAWQADAQALLADYAALLPDERARLDHAIARINFRLVYEQELTTYLEFKVLGPAAQSIYRRINLFRHRLALLCYEAALAPGSGVEETGKPQLAVYASLRLRDLLAATTIMPAAELAAERDLLWRHAVRVFEWTPQDLPGYPGHAARVALNWHRRNFTQFGPVEPITIDGRNAPAILFGRQQPQTAPNR